MEKTVMQQQQQIRVEMGARWTEAEDRRLGDYVSEHGPANWKDVAAHIGTGKTAYSCRQRWSEFHQSGVKKGEFTDQEMLVVLLLHSKWGGNKWSRIARHLRGRTGNQIKNLWNTKLKEKVTNEEMTKLVKNMAQNVDLSTITAAAYDELIKLLPHLDIGEADSATAESVDNIATSATMTSL